MNQTNDILSIYDHFNHLISLSVEVQANYLAQHFPDGGDEKSELIALLDCYHNANDDTDWQTLVADHAQDMTGDKAVEHLTGQQVGQFTLGEIIGRGGMGVVYVATRTDGKLAHKVAIKFLFPSIMHLIGENLVHNEAHILSQLNHPNITHVLDAGTFNNNYHYFVMEYVDGIPINQYCTQQKLNINERIKLFLKVCDAISKAHLLNIAHTDIKPSNILVNNEGIVKVLDFGIAKLIHGDTNIEKQKMVQRYLRALSINYASPEQLKNKQLSLQTDQYSLGILLYQLLTDKTPFSRDRHAIHEIVEQVSQGNIPSLASRVNGFMAKQQLSGDINVIVHKALSPTTNNRYESLNDFRSDIYRYLKKLPIRAKNYSLIYRTQKWLARSPAQAAVLFISLSAALLLWQQNKQVELEKNNALEVANQLTAMFEATDPTQGGNSDLKAVDILRKGEQTIKASQALSDEVKYHLLTVLAKSYSGIGHLTSAENLLEGVLKNKEQLSPKQYGDVLLALARNYQSQTKNKKAEVTFKKLFKHAEQYPLSTKEQFYSYLQLANVLYKNYKSDANKTYSDYLIRSKQLLGSLSNIEKATILYLEAQEQQNKIWNQHTDKQNIIIDQARYAKAITPLIARYSEALDLASEDIELSIQILRSLRLVHFEINRRDTEMVNQLVNTKLAEFKQSTGEENTLIAGFYEHMAITSYDNLEMREALAMYDKALPIWEKTTGKSSFQYLQSLLFKGATYLAIGDVESYEKLLFQAKSIYDGMSESNISLPLKIGYWMHLRQYVYILFAQKRYHDALPYISEYIYLSKHDAQINAAEDTSTDVAEFTAYKIGLEQSFDKAIAYWNKTEPTLTNRHIQLTVWNKAMLLAHNKQHKEAYEYWQQIIPSLLHYPTNRIDVYQNDIWWYQQSLIANNKLEEAKELTLEVVNYLKQVSDSKDNYWLNKAKQKQNELQQSHPALFE